VVLIFPVRSLSQDQAILPGAQTGRRLFAALVNMAAEPRLPEAAFLDFAGIQVATASCLRESVVAFRDHARTTLPNLYPVVANPNASVREELDFFLRQRKDAMWSCALDAHGVAMSPELLGVLDEAHTSAFDLVRSIGSASAPDLAARSDAAIGPTAWNNRLSQLAGRGLLIERKAGKTKTFFPVLETN
jgi:hypothetical protein